MRWAMIPGLLAATAACDSGSRAGCEVADDCPSAHVCVDGDCFQVCGDHGDCSLPRHACLGGICIDGDRGAFGDPPYVVVTPADGATDVATDTTIILNFSQPIEQPTLETGGFCLEDAASLCANGAFQWTDSATAVFTPGAALAAGEAYSPNVHATVTNEEGIFLRSPGPCAPAHCSSFTTATTELPPTVTVTPSDTARGVALDSSVQFDFSRPMNVMTVESGGICVKKGATGSCMPGNLYWTGNQRVEKRLTTMLDPSTEYRVTVFGTVESATGLTLGGTGGIDCTAPDYCTTFNTSDGTAPTVIITPADMEVFVEPDVVIILSFSETMDPASVTSRFSVSDGASTILGTIAWTGVSDLEFTPVNDLAFDTDYTITLDAGAADASGTAVEGAGGIGCTAPATCTQFRTRPDCPPVWRCDQCGTGVCNLVKTAGTVTCGCAATMPTSCGTVSPFCCTCCAPVDCCYDVVEETQDCNCRWECL